MISQKQIPNPHPSQDQSLSKKEPFSPHLTDTLKIKTDQPGNVRILGNATCFYSQGHNMIIVCPVSGTVQFYDATTLLPLGSRETLKIGETVTKIDYCIESDTFIMGCQEGSIYAYNASNQTLKKLRNQEDQVVFSVVFINPQSFAFSAYGYKQIQIGNLQQEGKFLSRDPRKLDPICLSHWAKRDMLFSGLFNGSVIMYRTSQLPKLPVVSSIRSQQMEGRFVMKFESARISNKELIIAYGSNGKIRVWNLIKGKMRLVRMINIGQIILSGIYLEDYKMLAITNGQNSVKFISLVTGKLESTLDLGMQVEKVFLMNDKNTLGVVDQQGDRIKMVKLGKPLN